MPELHDLRGLTRGARVCESLGIGKAAPNIPYEATPPASTPRPVPRTGREVAGKMLDNRKFGRWLDLMMMNRDITGRTLARKLKVDDASVSRWRRSLATPGMDTVVRLAKIFKVDPLRLAVTAGLMNGPEVGIEPLPMPEPTAQRNLVKERISRIPFASKAELEFMLEQYDEFCAKEYENHDVQ